MLQTKADAFNAGYGKKVRRVIFCKDAGMFVEQAFDYYNSDTKKEWYCLHE